MRRVAFDAHVISGKPQGSATYLRRMLAEIAKLDLDFQLVVYCHAPSQLESTIRSPSFELRDLPREHSASRLLYTFPRLLKRDQIDLAVFQYIAPPFSPVAVLLVVHDVLPLTHPHLFERRFRWPWALLARWSMRNARSLVTVSQSSAAEIRRCLPDADQPLYVTHDGPSFEQEQYFSEPSAGADIRRPCRDPYVLCVGRIERRKNIDLLVRAFREACLTGVKLVLVGRREAGFMDVFSRHDDILQLEDVTDADLIGIYRNASLFVYPSEAEGFGIPLLDALLMGLPTVCSDRSCLREIAAGLATFFDPAAPDAVQILREEIRRHFLSRPLPAPSAESRRALVARFNWGASAAILCEAIRGSLKAS